MRTPDLQWKRKNIFAWIQTYCIAQNAKVARKIPPHLAKIPVQVLKNFKETNLTHPLCLSLMVWFTLISSISLIFLIIAKDTRKRISTSMGKTPMFYAMTLLTFMVPLYVYFLLVESEAVGVYYFTKEINDSLPNRHSVYAKET